MRPHFSPSSFFPSHDDRLLNEITRLAKVTDGQVGLTAIHIESGRRVVFTRPTASRWANTFKVPIAVQIPLSREWTAVKFASIK